MLITPNETLATIVSRNIHAATVLNEYGIDYFSRGNRSLEMACLEDNKPMAAVLEDLGELNGPGPKTMNFQAMSLTQLSTYILKTHHRFAEKKVTFIKHALARLLRESGSYDDKLDQIQNTFNDLSVYLTVHMRHEELVVFPFIQKLARGNRIVQSLSSQIVQPIMSMQEDHRYEVDTLRRLVFLINNYLLTKKADYALKITYDAIRELEQDLKIHMHLENNVLFPGAVYLANAYMKNMN